MIFFFLSLTLFTAIHTLGTPQSKEEFRPFLVAAEKEFRRIVDGDDNSLSVNIKALVKQGVKNVMKGLGGGLGFGLNRLVTLEQLAENCPDLTRENLVDRLVELSVRATKLMIDTSGEKLAAFMLSAAPHTHAGDLYSAEPSPSDTGGGIYGRQIQSVSNMATQRSLQNFPRARHLWNALGFAAGSEKAPAGARIVSGTPGLGTAKKYRGRKSLYDSDNSRKTLQAEVAELRCDYGIHVEFVLFPIVNTTGWEHEWWTAHQLLEAFFGVFFLNDARPGHVGSAVQYSRGVYPTCVLHSSPLPLFVSFFFFNCVELMYYRLVHAISS